MLSKPSTKNNMLKPREIYTRIAAWPIRRQEKATAAIALFFCAISAGLIYWQLFPGILTRSFVPLHYNIHSGVDLFGPSWRIFTLPALNFIFALVNLALARYTTKRDRFLASYYYIITIFSSLLFFVGTIFVVLLNISFYG